ncbi:MAG: single-stranded DNA-binding protein [Candidatus Poribacteria bacterium]|nr:single-stranded DNA-binding protein [Candidatus Poribacteria bacterium]
MAAELNRIIVIGNLTRDPEMRILDSGTAVTKLGLAVNTTYVSNGERQEDVCFINVDAWGRIAETANQYLRKGSKVLIEGRLQYRTWETDSGDKRSVHDIRAQSIQFLDRPGGGDGGGDYSDGASDPAPARSSSSRPARRSAPANDDIEDDIPF